MLKRHIAAIGAAAIIPLAAIVAAAAQTELRQTPGSNITISTCDPHRHGAGVTHPWIDPYGIRHYPGDFPSDEGFLAIDYQNTAKTAATEIDFGLVARGSLVATAKDVGTFSPAVKISHEFVISREVFPIGTEFPYCAVLRVKYSDGTEWRNPNPPPTG
ncbi:MAG TPA: hypothetical protein VKT51_05025 [Candidatus Eremiobacteraceae bacterium]|nr:hypothetical protein [Candidatus Eremiobacteraceae bacterium]